MCVCVCVGGGGGGGDLAGGEVGGGVLLFSLYCVAAEVEWAKPPPIVVCCALKDNPIHYTGGHKKRCFIPHQKRVTNVQHFSSTLLLKGVGGLENKINVNNSMI